jgi:hypothetical protein
MAIQQDVAELCFANSAASTTLSTGESAAMGREEKYSFVRVQLSS